MYMSISVVVIAKNSQQTIEQTLKSVQFADEVILVDILSTDDTLRIAEKYCTRIYNFEHDSKFVEPVRNFALAKAKKDWVLVLDADEEIPSTLADKLQEIDQKDLGDVFYLPRKNIVSGFFMQHTAWWPDYQLRFFKRDLVSWSDKIHAAPVIATNQQVSHLEIKEELAILHHNYKDTADYLSRFNRYTDIEAEQKTLDIISPATLLRVFSDDLFRRFFAKEGHLDGVRGLYLSVMQAAYQMTVQMKIFDRLGNKASLEKNSQAETIQAWRCFQKELNYWVSDLEIKHSRGFRKIIALIRKKLSL